MEISGPACATVDPSGEHQTLRLTTTGRTTGRPREIEIWFVSADGKFYMLAEQFHRAQWVKNIERYSRVQVRIGDRQFSATARTLDPERDVTLWQKVQQLARQKYGWGEGLPVELIPETEIL